MTDEDQLKKALEAFENEWYGLDYVTEPTRHRRALSAALSAFKEAPATTDASTCPDCGGESWHHTVECFTGEPSREEQDAGLPVGRSDSYRAGWRDGHKAAIHERTKVLRDFRQSLIDQQMKDFGIVMPDVHQIVDELELQADRIEKGEAW